MAGRNAGAVAGFASQLDRHGVDHVEEEEVDRLLAAAADEQLLRLNAYGRSVGTMAALPQTQTDSATGEAGVGPDLTARLAKLRKGPATAKAATTSAPATAAATAPEQGRAATVNVAADPDALGDELAARLQALRHRPGVKPKPAAPVAATVPIIQGPSRPPPAGPAKGDRRRQQGPSGSGKVDDRSTSAEAWEAQQLHDTPPELESLSSEGRPRGLSFWGIGKARGKQSKQEAGEPVQRGELGSGANVAELNAKAVRDVIFRVEDELRLKGQPSSLSQSVVSGSGYLCEDEQESDVSTDAVEREVDGIVEWAKDAVALEASNGIGDAYDGDQDFAPLVQEGEGHLEGERVEDDKGYWQDEEGDVTERDPQDHRDAHIEAAPSSKP